MLSEQPNPEFGDDPLEPLFDPEPPPELEPLLEPELPRAPLPFVQVPFPALQTDWSTLAVPE
jgi:hypothetical protein